MRFEIRPMNVADDKELLAVQRLKMKHLERKLGAAEWKPLEQFRASVTDTEFVRSLHAVAEASGLVVGYAVGLLPQKENTDRVTILVLVDPKFRGRGIGTALMQCITDSAAELGRTNQRARFMFPAEVDPGRPNHPNNRLAAAFGMKRHRVETCRAVHLPLAVARLAELRSFLADRPLTYDIVGWVGPVPNHFLDQVAALETQLEQEAIGFDAGEGEAAVWTPERIRQDEVSSLSSGELLMSCAAVAPDGRLAAYSLVSVANNDQTQIAWQRGTIVHDEHRGAGLGLALKLETHQALARSFPSVKLIATWNSENNEAMLNINEALGYRVAAREVVYRAQ